MAKKFTQRETEQLIAGIREAYESKMRQLQYRLDGLVAENRSLRASLAEYKNREGKIGRAIVAAEEKGEEIKEFYRMSAETEWKTLKLFADKWKRLAAQMAGLIPQEEAERYEQFAENLSALLGKEAGSFSIQEAEAAPVPEPEKFDPKAVMEKYIEGEEETGFNLDDVLNPKGNLDLEKLCRSLGLMEEESAAPAAAAEENTAQGQREAREESQPSVRPVSPVPKPAPQTARPAAATPVRPAGPGAVPSSQKAQKPSHAAKPNQRPY